MPQLILLNGPPGSGKSTLADRYVQDHPLALNLDIDRVRAMLGRWRDTPGDAGRAARAIALAAAMTHLGSGHDVIVPQLIARVGFLDQLDAAAAEVEVAFVEIVLLDSKENTRTRFVQRTEAARSSSRSGPEHPAADRMATDHLYAGHREAAEMLEIGGGLAQLDRYYDDLVALLPSRPRAQVVTSRTGQVEETYQAVLAVVDR